MWDRGSHCRAVNYAWGRRRGRGKCNTGENSIVLFLSSSPSAANYSTEALGSIKRSPFQGPFSPFRERRKKEREIKAGGFAQKLQLIAAAPALAIFAFAVLYCCRKTILRLTSDAICNGGKGKGCLLQSVPRYLRPRTQMAQS